MEEWIIHGGVETSGCDSSFAYVCVAGAAETFRGIGMASLVILLIFSLIQYCSGEAEEKGGNTPSVQTHSLPLAQ